MLWFSKQFSWRCLALPVVAPSPPFATWYYSSRRFGQHIRQMLVMRGRNVSPDRTIRPTSALLWTIIPSRFCLIKLQYVQSVRLVRRRCSSSSASFRSRPNCRSSRRMCLPVLCLHFPDDARKLSPQGLWPPCSHRVLHVVRELCVVFWPPIGCTSRCSCECSISFRRSWRTYQEECDQSTSRTLHVVCVVVQRGQPLADHNIVELPGRCIVGPPSSSWLPASREV